jgi:hypothetical protein
LVLLSVCAASAVNAQGAANNTKRWAIVPTDPQGRALADLLAVELSSWDNVQLVERERIDGVLAELRLNASGLVNPERAARFGQLTRADALALIDVPSENNKAKAVRLRLVDTRTSIRLLDVLLPAGDLEAEVAAMRDELKSASATLAVPPDKLRLIGLVPIASGEPGEFLKPFCQTLTTLVEVGLQQNPRLVVVERSELKRLTAEANLSGLPLDIRASSRLLEASIRRADGGKGMLATCRLISGGESQDFDLTVASGELVDLRQEIIAAVSREIGGGEQKRGLSLAAEANVFDRRAALFRNSNRDREAAEMADAALALAPSKERLATALTHYASVSRANKNLFEGLEAACRHQELRLQWWAKTKPGDPIRSTVRHRPLYLTDVKIPWGRFITPEIEPLIDKWYAMSQQLFDEFYADASSASERIALLKEQVQVADSSRKSPDMEQRVKAVSMIVGRVQAVINEEPIPKDSNGVDYGFHTMLLMSAVDFRNAWVNLRDRRGRLRTLEGLSIDLGPADERAVQVAELYEQAFHSNNPDAAVRFLSLIDEWPPSELGPSFQSGKRAAEKLRLRSYFSWLRSRVLKRYPDIAAPYVKSVLRHSEESGDAKRLLALARMLTHLPVKIPAQEREEFASRILEVIDNPKYSRHVSDVAMLKRFAGRYGRREEMPAFAFDKRQGPWQQYVRIPIKLSVVNLKSVFVDHRADASRAGGRLVVLWSNNQVVIERVSLDSNTPRKTGRVIPFLGSTGHSQGHQMAFGPNALFVTSGTGGFTMLQKDALEVITEEDGAPSGEIWSMAWYKNRLLLGYKNAFASFDPKTKAFQLLASGTSFEPRNPIDGHGSFFIRYLLSDEANGCVWIFIQDNAGADRTGVWKFVPETGTYQKLASGYSKPTPTEHGWLLHNSGKSTLSFLDAKTAKMTHLKGYKPAAKREPMSRPEAIKVGDHIITMRGSLYTPNGKEYRIKTDGKWSLLQRVGPGFITHYDRKSRTLWYVKPK